MVSSGKAARKCLTALAIELTWPGVPVTAWASMRPSASKTPAERSPASRTEVEKVVRTRVCACSSTTAMRRDHMICMWICARAEFALLITVMREANPRGGREQHGRVTHGRHRAAAFFRRRTGRRAIASPDVAAGLKNAGSFAGRVTTGSWLADQGYRWQTVRLICRRNAGHWRVFRNLRMREIT